MVWLCNAVGFEANVMDIETSRSDTMKDENVEGVTYAENKNMIEGTDFGGARPKNKTRNARRDSPLVQKATQNKNENQEQRESRAKEEKAEIPIHKKRYQRGKQEEKDVYWGMDESSESDTGWNCDEGDTLLPR